jgi:hypothetical protein
VIDSTEDTPGFELLFGLLAIIIILISKKHKKLKI